MSQVSECTEGSIDVIEECPEPPDVETEEEEVFCAPATLYRFSSELHEWIGRGNGRLRILKHRETSRYRILLRQAKTYIVRLNQQILAKGPMEYLPESDREIAWLAYDSTQGRPKRDIFAAKFALPQTAEAFKTAFNEGRAANAAVN